MPWSGAGVYTLVYDWVNDKNSAINPQAVRFKTQDDDIATALNNCLTRDAQGKPSGNFSFNAFRGISLGAATARTDAIQAAQVQDGSVSYVGSVAGTDTITGSLTPAVTAYLAGMRIVFKPAATNTGAATINLNGVGAATIQKQDGDALAAGDLVINIPAFLVYTGSVFLLLNPQSANLNNGVAMSDLARLSQSNVFTSGTQTVSAAGTVELALTSTNANDGRLKFSTNSAVRGYIGAPGAAANLITGSAVGDLILRAESGGLLFSGNAGTTAHFALSSAGVLTTPNASASEVGYKGMPVSIQSADYTLVLSDAGKYIIENGSPTKTVTIPANGSVAFPIGTTIVIENGSTSVNQTIAITTDTLYLVATAFATTGSRTLLPGGVATLFKRTATTWIISGPGVT